MRCHMRSVPFLALPGGFKNEDRMINQVKIFDGKGNLKKIIPCVTLADKHWKDFKEKGLTNQAVVRKKAGGKNETRRCLES